MRPDNRYKQILRESFRRFYDASTNEANFTTADMRQVALDLGLDAIGNKADNIYTYRHGRSELPQEIVDLAPSGKTWVIMPSGKGKYRFAAVRRSFIEAAEMEPTLIADATPQILSRFEADDEQAVLARLLYGRLIDVFLGVSAYRLQSHLRTSLDFFGGAQIEIDDVYVGTEKSGAHFIIPVQAKGTGAKERISCVQLIQDWAWCHEVHTNAIPRVLAAKLIQRKKDKTFGNILTLALIEVAISRSYTVRKVREQHFRLVPSSMIDDHYLKETERAYLRASRRIPGKPLERARAANWP